MGVLLHRNKFNSLHKKGGAIDISENPNKFNSVPSGIIGQANILSTQKPAVSNQQQRPTTAVISYGNEALSQINFRRQPNNKRVTLRL